MAIITCLKCGAQWTDETPEGKHQAVKFATPTFPAGNLLTVAELVASGEDLLACPKDPDPRLDGAIQRSSYDPRDRLMPPAN